MANSATDQRPQTVIEAIKLSSGLLKRAGLEATGDTRADTNALLAQVQRDRLVWAMAPVERGGLGASLSETASITFHLAKASGSLGLMYAMHASQAFTLLRHGAGSPLLESLTDRLIADQALVASGTSEKGVGGNIFGSTCVVEEDENGGHCVSKESPNISYLDHAGAVLVTAMREAPKGAKARQVLIAAETGRMTLEPGPEAEMMGMRGIVNRPCSFTARFESGAIFEQDYPQIAGQTMTPFIHVLWAALWSGLAAQALAKAKASSAKSAAAGDGAELTKTEFSRLANKHYTMNALIREAALETGESASGASVDLGRTAKIKRLKIVCSELLEEICVGSLSVIGFAAYAEKGKFSLSEVIRDALSARVMISNYRLLLANSSIERFVEETL